MSTHRILVFLKKPRNLIAIGIGLAAVALGIWMFARRGSGIETVQARRGTIAEEVSVTGRVVPAQTVDLAFEKSGRVAAVTADVGQVVAAGQTIVRLENGDLSADLAEAEANLKVEKAQFEEVRRGTRPEEIAIAETKVANAKVALEDAVRNAVNESEDAHTTADDSLGNKIDQFFTNPRTEHAQITFVTDGQLEAQIESGRVDMERMLKAWKPILAAAFTDETLAASKRNLYSLQSYLDVVARAVNQLVPTNVITQTTIDKYKTDVSAARANVTAAIASVTDAEEKLRTARSNLAIAERELELKKAGSTPEQLIAAAADIERAQANVDNIRAQILKSLIIAPIAGTISRQDAKVGQVVAPNVAVVSLISASQYEIEANVSEADIAKVALGNRGRATLDAYGDDVVFETKVVEIDPAETFVEGIATYKVTFQFIEKDDRIKSGMTASLDVETAKKGDVLVIPARAIITKDGVRKVRIVRDEERIEEVPVEIGLRGADGNIEIIKGIAEGDAIAVTVPEE